MKTPRLPLLAALAALVSFGPVRAADNSVPPDNKVYVRIENFDPIHFERLRRAWTNGDELILSTLKASATEQARFAGYAGEVMVLEEKAQAPDGATVLVLAWDEKSVFANVVRNGKDKYLGVVSRLPLASHPDFNRLRQSIDHAGLADARHDAAVQVQVQVELYAALKYLVEYQKAGASGS